MPNTSKGDHRAKQFFILSFILTLVGGSFAYGVASYHFNTFPVPLLKSMYWDLKELLFPSDSILSDGWGRHP
jgi:hypothetical protein